MKQLEHTLTFRWWRDCGKDIPEEHIEELQDHAKTRITEQWAQGYVQGELCESLLSNSPESGCCGFEEEIEYTGWWSVNIP
jgi:hypothetical protein